MNALINLHHEISAIVASGSQKHAVGDVVEVTGSGCYGTAKYVFAYNGSNTAITAGHFVHPLTACSGYTITQSAATNARPIGVAVHSQVATGEYFWMLVGGWCPRVEVTSNLAAGSFVHQAANGTATSTAPTGHATAGLAAHIGAIGYVNSAIATSSSGAMYLYPLI